jgi:hypothetical protein
MTSQDKQPVAYCAPGRRMLAALVLALRGEQVSEIREHRWLEGLTDIYVMTEPEFPLPVSVEAFRVTPRSLPYFPVMPPQPLTVLGSIA